MRPPRSAFPIGRNRVLVEPTHQRGAIITVSSSSGDVAVKLAQTKTPPWHPPVRTPTLRQSRRVARHLGTAAIEPVALWIDEALVEFAWEDYLLGLGIIGPAVRIGLSEARASRLPLFPPLYWCHVGPTESAIDGDLASFGEFAAIEADYVADFSQTASLHWPRVDLVTMTVTPEICKQLDRPGLQRSASNEYSVGWFERFMHRYQVRALVLLPEDPLARQRALALADDLVVRGGPAVGVGPADGPGTMSARSIASDVLSGAAIEDIARVRPGWAWWAGPGREHPLLQAQVIGDPARWTSDQAELAGDRPSVLARGHSLNRILALSSALEVRGAMSTRILMAQQRIEALPGLRNRFLRGRLPAAKLRRQTTMLKVSPPSSIRTPWQGVESLASLRMANPARVTLTTALLGEEAVGVAPARYVNMYVDHVDPFLKEREPLTVGEPCSLHLYIGPEGVNTPRRADPLDEIVVWQEDEVGVWLDFAVAGLDFEILGAAIQQVWLPRRGLTGGVTFRMVPTRPGASAMRVQVYARGRLLQSYKLAAITYGANSIAPSDWQSALADALRPAPFEDGELVDDAGVARSHRTSWQHRVRELDLVEDWDLVDRPNLAPRVSISVNRHADTGFVSVRLGERYEVNKGLPTTLGETVRESLAAMMGHDQADSFGFSDGTTAANAERLGRQLVNLAIAGNTLFLAAFAEDVGEALRELSDETIVEVAHVIAANAIPWNVVYDRDLGTNRGTPNLCPVGFEAVGAGHSCGELEGCLAAGPEGAPGVLCPRGFWGFRRRVELPLSASSSAPTTEPHADAGSVAILVDDAVIGAKNVERIREVARDAVGETHVNWPNPPKKPQLSEALADPNLASAYVSCHAFPSASGIVERLSFDGLKAKANDPAFDLNTNLIVTDLNHVGWLTRPLIVLNACGTAAYRGGTIPTLLSTLITRCGAGGVVATEISVLNPLAAAFGATLMRSYLGGSSVGDAVLIARRELAGFNNPLGLAWTVYSDSEQTRLETT